MPKATPGIIALACCALVFASAAVAAGADQKQAEPALTEQQQAANVESFDTAWETIRDKHWDPKLGGLDWEAVRDEVRPRVAQARTRSEYLAAMNGMIDRFGQSHFGVVPKNLYDQLREPAGAGPRDGTIGIDACVIDGQVLVTKVDQGTAAAELGVRPGWEILQIDGKPLGPSIAEAEEAFKDKASLDLIRYHLVAVRLAGEVGKTKAVRFRNGSDEEVTLDVELAPRKGSKFKLGIFPRSYVWLESERLEGNIGYVGFNAFMDPVNVMPAFEKAVRSFMDCEGIIIDIRGNGGGLPGMAMGMAGWLVEGEEQYLGTMHLRGTEIRLVVNPRPETFHGPVAVLIDGASVSCAEIFSGGMRDLERARLFGTRTAGAVLPASFMELANGDFLYYPVADYFSRSGARLEGVGVAPDVRAPHRRDALLEGRDLAVEEAIRWIQPQ